MENPSRRHILRQIALLGTGYCLTPSASAKTPVNVKEFEPASPIFWLDAQVVWTATSKTGGIVLTGQTPGQPPKILAALGGPPLCRPGTEAYLYARAPDAAGTIKLTGATIETIPDKGRALEDCQFSRARERERLEKLGFAGLTAASINQTAVLACRQIESSTASELLIFNGDQAPLRTTVDWPLSRDNPVLMADPHTKTWIAYPSLTFKRRQSLKGSLAGIPVARITQKLEVTLTWIPWAEWNLDGPYRFYPLGNELIAAMSLGWTPDGEKRNGVYFAKDNKWERRFPGQIDITSLAVSSDQKHIAWAEQIKMDPPSPIYGKYRKVVRIEAL